MTVPLRRAIAALATAAALVWPAQVQGASQVATTTTTDAFSSASRFFTHCANGNYWVTFHNGTTPVLYSSPDGAVWTARGNVFSGIDPLSAGQWAARFSGDVMIAFGTTRGPPRSGGTAKALSTLTERCSGTPTTSLRSKTTAATK